MALVLKRRLPGIRRKVRRRAKVNGNVAKRLKRVWDSPEDYEPQI
ncbi:MAG: hypothetical protein WHS82_00560 [Candidatus Methanosuratincola sp.]